MKIFQYLINHNKNNKITYYAFKNMKLLEQLDTDVNINVKKKLKLNIFECSTCWDNFHKTVNILYIYFINNFLIKEKL